MSGLQEARPAGEATLHCEVVSCTSPFGHSSVIDRNGKVRHPVRAFVLRVGAGDGGVEKVGDEIMIFERRERVAGAETPVTVSYCAGGRNFKMRLGA